MSQPIYKLWVLKSAAAWYQASEAEKSQLMSGLEEAREKTGNKMLIAADPSWSSEQYSLFGIDEFPDFAAVREFSTLLDGLQMPHYVNSMSLLGNAMQPPEEHNAANQILKLFMFRPTAAWHQLSQADRDSMTAKLGEAIKTVGGQGLLYCNSSWASEQWQIFGLEAFPDLEAVQKLAELHTELNWYQYIDGKTMLGTLYTQE
jgi:hypothetical protein